MKNVYLFLISVFMVPILQAAEPAGESVYTPRTIACVERAAQKEIESEISRIAALEKDGLRKDGCSNAKIESYMPEYIAALKRWQLAPDAFFFDLNDQTGEVEVCNMLYIRKYTSIEIQVSNQFLKEAFAHHPDKTLEQIKETARVMLQQIRQ